MLKSLPVNDITAFRYSCWRIKMFLLYSSLRVDALARQEDIFEEGCLPDKPFCNTSRALSRYFSSRTASFTADSSSLNNFSISSKLLSSIFLDCIANLKVDSVCEKFTYAGLTVQIISVVLLLVNAGANKRVSLESRKGICALHQSQCTSFSGSLTCGSRSKEQKDSC